MKRVLCNKREEWQERMKSLGFPFYNDPDGKEYWKEGNFYSLDISEHLSLKTAIGDLHKLCLDSIPHIINDENTLMRMRIPKKMHDIIRRSWKEDRNRYIYGRFDLLFDKDGVPKMLEYNADTPTTLLEGGKIQYDWLKSFSLRKDSSPGDDDMEVKYQFNNLEEMIIERWKELSENNQIPKNKTVYFASVKDHQEDMLTTKYMQSLAEAAGLSTEYIHVEDIGFNDDKNMFVDTFERPIRTLWKLYPWEWLMNDPFIEVIENVNVIEPAWKLILSNKCILPVLYEMHRGHPNLLPAFFTKEEMISSGIHDFVEKPVFGREGANVTMYSNDVDIYKAKDEGYIDNGFIYQAKCSTYFSSTDSKHQTCGSRFSAYPESEHSLPAYHPVIGGWVIGDVAGAISIREDLNPVTTNTSQFVPHVIKL